VNRRGMTLIELLVTLTLIGILANFALPAYSTIRRRAEAARIIADVHAVRIAALDYYADRNRYPPPGQWGAAPGSMASSLAQGFEWRYRDVEYRWERWSLPNGMPTNPSQTVLLGLSVRTTDPAVMTALRGLYKGQVAFGTAAQITLVLE
jgi:prepilin-type N-terminal cleavage/methylation domain-containing protein